MLERSVAQAIVCPAEPGYRVTEVLPRAGGEVSTVYEVRGADGARPYIVKVYPPWSRPKLIKEVYVYRLLARHGIRPVPRVLHASLAGVVGLRSAYTVMSTLDGEPLSGMGSGLTGAEIDRIYRQLGALLADIHRIGLDRWGYLTTRIVDDKPTNTAYALDQFARRLRSFTELDGDPALAAAIDRNVGRQASVLAGCGAPVLCHNDFHEGNVLVSRDDGGQWRVSGVVDVENAVSADPLFDLARTDFYALRDDPARRSAFLDGYGPLPPGGEQRIALYRLHHALEQWNWAAARGEATDQGRIEMELARLESGV